MLVASTRLVWPPEILIILLFLATTIAFDFVCLTTFQAKSKEAVCVLEGFLFVGKVRPLSLNEDLSFSWPKLPPEIVLIEKDEGLYLASFKTRKFFFFEKTENGRDHA